MDKWIWQHQAWPEFYWDHSAVAKPLKQIEAKQFLLAGKASAISDPAQNLNNLLANLVASFEIENEQINVYSLRSSLAKHLSLNDYQPGLVTTHSEGLAQLTLQTLSNLEQDLTLDQLLAWHKLLFAGEQTSIYQPISAGKLRGEELMQVVSGRFDKPKVHFEAPPRAILEPQLLQFINWFNTPNPAVHPIIRAAIAHFWLITLHPFEDGNGRLTRALTERALAQADQQNLRLYAMAASILQQRKDYYQVLENSQKWPTVIDDKPVLTDWINWFLQCLEHSLDQALQQIDRTLTKAKFWQFHQATDLSLEQKKVLNRLLDGGETGFEQGISASQYQKVAKVSKATATRHLADLLAKNCLEKLPGGGRSTRYQIKPQP